MVLCGKLVAEFFGYGKESRVLRDIAAVRNTRLDDVSELAESGAGGVKTCRCGV